MIRCLFSLVVLLLGVQPANAQQVTALTDFTYWGSPQGSDLLLLDGGDVIALIPDQVKGSAMRKGQAQPFRLERRGADLSIIWSQPVPVVFEAGVDGMFKPSTLQMTWLSLFIAPDAAYVFEATEGKLLAHGYALDTGEAMPVREVGVIQTPTPGKRHFAFKSRYNAPPIPQRTPVPFDTSANGEWFVTAHTPVLGKANFTIYDQKLVERKRLQVTMGDEVRTSVFLGDDGTLVITQVDGEGQVTVLHQPLRGRSSSVSFPLRQRFVFDILAVVSDKRRVAVVATTGEEDDNRSQVEVVQVAMGKRKVASHVVFDDASLKTELSVEMQEHYYPLRRKGLELLPLLVDEKQNLLVTLRPKYSQTTVTTTTNSSGTSTSASTKYIGERSLVLSVSPEGEKRYVTMLQDYVRTAFPFELYDMRLLEADKLRVLWRSFDFSWKHGSRNALTYADLQLETGIVSSPQQVLPDIRAGELFMPQLSAFVSMDEMVLVSRAWVFGFGRAQAESTIISRVQPGAPLLPPRSPLLALPRADKSHADWQLGAVVGKMTYRTDGMRDYYRGAGIGFVGGFVGAFSALKLYGMESEAANSAGSGMFLGGVIGTPLALRYVGSNPEPGWWTLQSPQFQLGYLKYERNKRRKRASWGAFIGSIVGVGFGASAAM